MSSIVLPQGRKQKIWTVLRAYWLSPFCSGKIELGEQLLSWALSAETLASKAYADAYDSESKIAYQIKTGLPDSPVTFARLTTPSQSDLVNSSLPADAEILGKELLSWVSDRIQQPRIILGAEQVRTARLIYTVSGDFTYYEREADPGNFDPRDYSWQWSSRGNALEGYKNNIRWFSWYPQGRQNTKNQNQLHFHGENLAWFKLD
jgi:hypothetical protein